MSQIQEVNLCAKESDEIEDDAKGYDLDTDDENEEDRDDLDNDEENEEDQKSPQLVYEYDKIQDHRMVTLLKETTLQLDDGRTILILSRGPRYSEEKWPVNCHVCSCSSMYTFERVMDHLSSSTHEINAEILKSGRKFYDPMRPFIQTVDLKDPELTPIRIHGGEVITEITRDLTWRYRRPIPKESMGISYGYKILPDIGKNYFCMLCRERGTIFHFRGRVHATKYIWKHFPETQKKLKPLVVGRSKIRQRDFIYKVIMTIYKKIADEKFEKLPKYVPLKKLKENMDMFYKSTINQMHISEKMISISDQWLNELALEYGKHDAKTSLASIEGQSEIEKERTKKKKEKKKNRKEERKKIREEKKKIQKVENPLTHSERWDKLRLMTIPIIDDLNKLYSTYITNLESHPSYKKEWGLFWKKRSIELRRAGIDPESYDFNAEWLPHWKKRLTGLKIEKMYINVHKFQKQLNINMRAKLPPKIKSELYSRLNFPIPEPPTSGQPHVINSRSTSSNEPPSKKRCDDDSKHPTVVSVIRIAAALEDHLGSLGPQAIQLLGRAVVSEKTNTNPDTLLMDNEYYIFLMTVNEKLKGHLQTKIVAQRTLDAFDCAVKEISAILPRFEELRARGPTVSSLFGGVPGHATVGVSESAPKQTRKFETTTSNRLKRGRDLNTSLNYNHKTTIQPLFEEFGDRRHVGNNQRNNQSMPSNNFSGPGDCANNYTVASGGYDVGNSSNMSSSNADKRQTDYERKEIENECGRYGGNYDNSDIQNQRKFDENEKFPGESYQSSGSRGNFGNREPSQQIYSSDHIRGPNDRGVSNHGENEKSQGDSYRFTSTGNVSPNNPNYGSIRNRDSNDRSNQGENNHFPDNSFSHSGSRDTHGNRGPNNMNYNSNRNSGRGDSYSESRDTLGKRASSNLNYGSNSNRGSVSNYGENNNFGGDSRSTHENRESSTNLNYGSNLDKGTNDRGLSRHRGNEDFPKRTLDNRQPSNQNYEIDRGTRIRNDSDLSRNSMQQRRHNQNASTRQNTGNSMNYHNNGMSSDDNNFHSASGGRSGYGQYSNSNRDNFGDRSSTGRGGHWRTGDLSINRNNRANASQFNRGSNADNRH